jgi:cytochrome b6-f complex iron-sulfur subunit
LQWVAKPPPLPPKTSSPKTQGDPTYLVVKDDGTIENYGINAVCTHLGCVVPWVAVRFACLR